MDTKAYEATASGKVVLMTLASSHGHASARFRAVIDTAPGIAPDGYYVDEARVDVSRRCDWESCYRECVGCKLASTARQGYSEAWPAASGRIGVMTDDEKLAQLAFTDPGQALEHAKAALARDNEGIRLWMLDCGELVAKHRARAEAAEAELARLRRCPSSSAN